MQLQIKIAPSSFHQYIAATSQNSLAGGSRDEQQAVARVNPGPEVAAILYKILSGSTCSNPEIQGGEVLPKKIFLDKLAATSGLTPSLETV